MKKIRDNSDVRLWLKNMFCVDFNIIDTGKCDCNCNLIHITMADYSAILNIQTYEKEN